MKITLCTTPIRSMPSDFPPFGVLSLIQALRQADFDPLFYDIDGLRPSFEEVMRTFRGQKPHLIGISAVVSTSYAYTKKLCVSLREALPDTLVVVGGNLAASAEILHRFGGAHLCVIGEGERAIVRLAQILKESPGHIPLDQLSAIKGITFVDENNQFVFTGYDTPLPLDESSDPDYSILESSSRFDNYFLNPLLRMDFDKDPRSREPHRRGQSLSTVITSKGCVNRCTFCHRWDKGLRSFSPESVVRKMTALKERYHVGFFNIGDENFGANRKWLEEFLRLIKSLDVLYVASGVRCRSVDLDLLKRLKESGCVALYYGMETGSSRILSVMEKNASREDNLRAAFWTREAGLFTVFQLVLGMPGETEETVDETIDFVKKVTEYLPEPPHKYLSINYVQALPGTPIYEYARHRRLMGQTLEEEDAYLTKISDIDASDDSRFLNFTNTDYFTVQTWRLKILLEADAHWYRLRHWKAIPFHLPLESSSTKPDYFTQGGYFNFKKLIHGPVFYRWGWPLRHLYYYTHVLCKDIVHLPPRLFGRAVVDFVKIRLQPRPPVPQDYRSLRRTLKEIPLSLTSDSEKNMWVLRQGR